MSPEGIRPGRWLHLAVIFAETAYSRNKGPNLTLDRRLDIWDLAVMNLFHEFKGRTLGLLRTRDNLCNRLRYVEPCGCYTRTWWNASKHSPSCLYLEGGHWWHAWRLARTTSCRLLADKREDLSPESRRCKIISPNGQRNMHTSIRSKNLCPPSTLLGMPSFCNADSITRDSALKRTVMQVINVEMWGFGTKHARRIAKSLHLNMPPLAATRRLISVAMNIASLLSDPKDCNTGLIPAGCDVRRDFEMRDLSA